MKTLYWLDRLTGRNISDLSPETFAGRFVLVSDEAVILNGFAILPGSFLIPSHANRINIGISTVSSLINGDMSFDQFPVRSERESLMVIGNRLGALENQQASWGDWLQVSPLVVGSLKKVELSRFDRVLAKNLWHLQRVSESPRTQLTIDIELLPVSRARRITSRTYEYLASHTEDWEYRKLTSVIPRKVLSTIPADLYNFYENRLAARMADEVFKYLSKRLAQLIKLDRFRIDLELGTIQRQNRVYHLLAEAVDADQMQANTRKTRQMLERLHRQIMMIFDQVLLKSIPKQTRDQVPPIVRTTNILVKDRHYRFVNLLWREWLSQHYMRPKTSQEIQRELQDLCAGFDRYCMLMIIRALDLLNFEPISGEQITRDRRTRLLSRSSDEIELLWTKEGLISIFRQEREVLRVIPLVYTITAASDVAEIDAQLKQLITSMNHTDSQCMYGRRSHLLIIYPGLAEERSALPKQLQLQVSSLGNDLLPPRLVGVIPISSYELGSLERVGRGLRWSIFGDQILSYPPQASIPVRHQDELLANAEWLQNIGKHGQVKVLRLPTRNEHNHYKAFVDDFFKEYARLGQKNGPDEKYLNQHQTDLQIAFKLLKGLRVCPLCGNKTRIENFYISEGDVFTCACPDRACQLSWGIRICGNCQQRYPYMAYDNPSSPANHQEADWIDQIYGMDILAIPCSTKEGSQTFICPNCGYCPNRSKTNRPVCLRCDPDNTLNEVKS